MTQYLRTFGSGSNIYSAEVSYRAVALSSNIQLQWPLESSPNIEAASSIMDVSATTSGLSIRLPDASLASTGQSILISNVGANAFSVNDYSNAVIQSIPAGQVWQIYVTNNTTQAGQWRSIQFGAATSGVNASALTSNAISTFESNRLIPAIIPSAYSTSVTVANVDWGRFVLWTQTTGSLILSSASTLTSGWYVVVRNAGNGSFTITPQAGDLINNASSLLLNVNESCIITTDGIGNFYTVGYGRDVEYAFNFVNVPILANNTSVQALTLAQFNKISYDFTGTLSSGVTKPILLPSYPQQYWVRNSTVPPSGTTAGDLIFQTASLGTRTVTVRSGQTAILYVDGSNNVTLANTSELVLPLPISDGGTGVTTINDFFVTFGAGSTGRALFQAETQQDALNVIGGASLGDVLALSIALG